MILRSLRAIALLGTTTAMAMTAMTIGACGSDPPADVAGTYSLNVTNHENGCNFMGWTEGESATNIGLAVTQTDADVTATLEGATGAYVMLVLGSKTFSGTVDANDVTMTLNGTRSTMAGNCSYFVNASVDATLAGDVLAGTIDYTTATNQGTDCTAMMLEGCHSIQVFNGARPPQ